MPQIYLRTYMFYMNRKGKIFVGSVIAVVAIIIGIVLLFNKKNDDLPISTEPTQEIVVGQYIRTSTKPWSNRAWLEKMNPEDIVSISFVKNRPDITAEKAWVFDGLSCYYYNGTVYIIVGNGLKILGLMNGAFSELTNLTAINGLDLIDTSTVVDMSELFKNCTSLTSVNVKDIETDSLLFANAMFKDCVELPELDMAGMNMENVVDMNSIFSGCMSLNNLYLPKTRDVMSLSRAFEKVGKRSDYTAYIHGALETGLCEDMSYMFNDTRIEDYGFVENFDTKNLKNAEGMFYDCTVSEVDLSSWDTENVTTTKNMFWSDSSLKQCNMTGWDMSSLDNCEGMFYFCTSLREIELDWENVNNIQNAAYLFKKCYQVTMIDVSCFDEIILGDAREMFWCCDKLTTIYGTSIKSDVSDRMFEDCVSIVGSVGYSEDLINGSMANTDGYFQSR